MSYELGVTGLQALRNSKLSIITFLPIRVPADMKETKAMPEAKGRRDVNPTRPRTRVKNAAGFEENALQRRAADFT